MGEIEAGKGRGSAQVIEGIGIGFILRPCDRRAACYRPLIFKGRAVHGSEARQGVRTALSLGAFWGPSRHPQTLRRFTDTRHSAGNQTSLLWRPACFLKAFNKVKRRRISELVPNFWRLPASLY